MRLSSTGKAATGTSEIGVDGAVPAALSGVVGGSRFGPAWLTSTKIVYQEGGSGSGPWVIDDYDVVSTAIVNLSASGQNDLAAGNSVWAAYLQGTGVRTSNGLGPFPNAALGDVSSDHGEIVLIDDAVNGIGLTVYAAGGGAPIYTASSAKLTLPLVRLRGHLLAYNATNWVLADVTGGSVSYAIRLNAIITWMTPLVTSAGDVLLLEVDASTNDLTLRYAAYGTGWTIRTGLSFNPDLIEYSSGVVRIGWCINQGESADSLMIGDLTLATGSLTTYAVSGGILVSQGTQILTQQNFPVGPPTGQNSALSALPNEQQPMIGPKGGPTPVWRKFFLTVAKGVSGNTQSINTIPPPVSANSFGVVASGTNIPISASMATDTLTITDGTGIAWTTNPATKTLTANVSGSGITRAQALAIASLRA